MNIINFVSRHLVRLNCAAFLLFLFPVLSFSQNSMVGDGFGGRLWYKPYNYSVGSYSAYTVCGDSQQLYGWGDNDLGQLGIGNTKGSSIPVKIIGMDHVIFHSAGYIIGAIKNDRSGWVWGNLLSIKPRKVISDVFFLNAGAMGCSFVKCDGTVWSVGYNGIGSFGNGCFNYKVDSVPQKMLSMNSAVRVAIGGSVNAVLCRDGKVWTAGGNHYGELGDGSPMHTKYAVNVPVKVKYLKDIVDVKATATSLIALDKNGDVYSWGAGSAGCLGTGSLNDTNVPVKIPGLKNIVAISGSNDGDHFLALDENHDAYVWGYNQWGQLGIGKSYMYAKVSKPVKVMSDVNEIMAGETFSYIIKRNGTLWAAGESVMYLSEQNSVFMDVKDSVRTEFVEIHPQAAPMYLCAATPVIVTNNYLRICYGDSVIFGKKYYKNTGIYYDTLKSIGGKDSLICRLDLQVGNKTYAKNTIHICENNYYWIGKNKYNISGKYLDTLINESGCDSIVETDLIVHTKSSVPRKHVIICKGSFIKLGDTVFTGKGTYYDTLLNQNGCDSVVITDVELDSVVSDFQYSNQNSNNADFYFDDSSSKNANIFYWDFGHNGSSMNNKNSWHNFAPDTGIFRVCHIVKSVTGCADTNCKYIVVKGLRATLFNVFTPGSDSKNDVYKIGYNGIFYYQIKIFNRWGEKVYATDKILVNDESKYWNGRVMNTGADCPSGSYFYQVYLYLNGPEKDPQKVDGSVTLLRQE